MGDRNVRGVRFTQEQLMAEAYGAADRYFLWMANGLLGGGHRRNRIVRLLVPVTALSGKTYPAGTEVRVAGSGSSVDGLFSLETERFFGSRSGRACPLVPELTNPFCTPREPTRRRMLRADDQRLDRTQGRRFKSG